MCVKRRLFFRMVLLFLSIVIFGLPLFPVSILSANQLQPAHQRIDYLIISNPNLANALIPLINYRKSLGLSVEVISPDTIMRNSIGRDRSEKIHFFLLNKYEAWNLKYLLLVGGFDEIPYKTLYPSSYQKEESSVDIGRTQSDYYYSDLSSDFDSNNDGYPGEYFLDNEIEFSSEVQIGRIPFDNIFDVSNMVNNILDFEKSAKSRTALLAASILSYKYEETLPNNYTQVKTDGASLTEAINRDIMSSYGYKIHRLYEISGNSPSIYRSEIPLKKLNFEKLLQTNPYDIVVWEGHGSSTSLETKIWNADQNQNNKAEKREITKYPILNQSSFNLPIKSKGIFITGSCSSMYPMDSNFGSMVLRAGFSAFIGGTSINWYADGWSQLTNGGNQSIMYLTLRNMILRNDTIGESLYKAIDESAKKIVLGSRDYQNFYSFNLYGDPAMRLIPIQYPTIDFQVDQESKTINLGDSLEFNFTIKTSQTTRLDLTMLAINYKKNLFKDPLFYADFLANNGKIKMKVLMAQNTFPTVYSMTIHFKTNTKNTYKVLKFLILPWESKPHLYLSYPDNQVKKNSEFTVDLCIRKAINVDTVYAEITFNDDILYINERSIFAGDFFGRDGILPKYNINVKPGLISISGARIKIQGISGDGILFSINFKAIKDGYSDIIINKFLVFDPNKTDLNKTPISYKKYDAKVTVSNSGIMINRNLAYGFETPKTLINNTGSTNGDKLWIGTPEIETIIDKSDSEKFSADITLSRWDNTIFWVAQKDKDNFIKIRIPVFSTNYISMNLKIGDSLTLVNGVELRLDSPPVLKAGRTMVPVRFISESFGANVVWDEKGSGIAITLKGVRIYLWKNNPIAIIEKNGARKSYKMDTAPIIVNGRTLVPVRFISEAYGSTIEWTQQYLLVEIQYLK